MITFGLIPGPWNQGDTISQVFWAIGFLGLLLIGVQGALALFAGHHGDLDGDVETESESHGLISLKTVTAMFIGVGFGGVLFGQNGFSLAIALGGGILIGIAIAVAYLLMMNGLHRLRSDGTAQLWEAIGQRATVYMRVPGNEVAPGEIQVSFGGRMMNIKAFTRGPELPTGTDVLVISVHGEHALEVEKVSTDHLTLK